MQHRPLVFALAALTDGLDGYLARRMNRVTGLGKLLAPTADEVAVLALLHQLSQLLSRSLRVRSFACYSSGLSSG